MKPFYEKQKGKLHIHCSNNLSFPEHLHEHIEILYLLEGELILTISETSYTMTKDSCAIIFPGQVHKFFTPKNSRLHILIFDTELSGEFQYSFFHSIPLHPCLSPNEVSPDILLALLRLYETDCAKNLTLKTAWIQVILALLFPKLSLSKIQKTGNETLIYQALHYLTTHFHETVTLETLANVLHVNKYYLSHTFSSKLQMSVPKYVNCLRLEEAVTLMRLSNKPLELIWEEAGFKSQRSFNRSFLEWYGMSPSKYRKEVLNKL